MTSFVSNRDDWTELLRTFGNNQQGADLWPFDSIRRAADAGIFRGMVPTSLGGWGWSPAEQCRALIDLSSRHLPTAFAITQLVAAIKRVAAASDSTLVQRVLEDLLSGKLSASVGISQLTTSGQHLDAPELIARRVDGGWQLDGRAPWITGAPAIDAYVVGCVCEDSRQLIVWIPADSDGVSAGSGSRLVAMSETKTYAVNFEKTLVPDGDVIAGPANDVLGGSSNSRASRGGGGGGGAGGLQTSALAIGLATASINVLVESSRTRNELARVASDLSSESAKLTSRLLAAAEGSKLAANVKGASNKNADNESHHPAAIRFAANDLVLRATQAELVAAKGAGFTEGHPAGNRCRQALFFLVWSCPAAVADEHFCRWGGNG